MSHQDSGMQAQHQQELARQLAAQAQQAIERQDWVTALDSAGRAILHWPHRREPYALIAQICCLRGNLGMGRSYLQLALGMAAETQSQANPTFDDDAVLQQRMAQWCQAGAATPPVPIGLPGSLQLVAGGDVMLGRQMPGWVGLRGAADPLAGVAALFRAADLSLVNLETCISSEGDFIDKGGQQPYYYHAHPEMLDVLLQAGVGCVTTGNNHAMDYGADALAQQTDTLEACGFLQFGAGRNRLDAALPKYAKVKGVTVAFIGVETETPVMAAGDATPGIHHVAVDRLASVLAGSIAIARAHADIVIVSPHWGINWLSAPSQGIQNSARQLIELGADAVLGHSAHILHGVAMHLGRPIIYDMGTLLFDRVAQHTMKDSALFALTWQPDGSCELTIRPVKLSNARARLATGEDFERIREVLTTLSLALDPTTRLEKTEVGLRVSGQHLARPTRRKPSLPSQPHDGPRTLTLPEPLRRHQSNLVYTAIQGNNQAWPRPLHINPNLTILGARYASPVRAGRGFVCEVYFQAAAPAMPSRVEARITGLRPDGSQAFAYTHPVAEGIHPPARWLPAQIICDRVVVRPVIRVPAGSYLLCWSLVDMEGGQAMPIATDDARLRFGQVYLGELLVNESAPRGVAGVSTAEKLVRLPALAVARLLVDWQQTPEDAVVAAHSPRQYPPKLATAENPLLLDAATMAAVTGGRWHNLPEGTLLTGLSFRRKYLVEGSAGNLFVAMKVGVSNETFDAESVASVRKAIQAGAAAAMVPTWAEGLPQDLPVLRVDHLLTAVEQLGRHVRDHLFTGQRVLVSGTEGKTGFKNMLHHALSPQISTHATTHSSNLSFAIMGSLASIRQQDRVAIIEAAGTHPGKLAQRSQYVRPHLFVLTEVGNEHLNYHGSQQAVIESKADIVTGLVDGGYGLLNADSRNYAAVRQAVLARRRVPLLLFGSSAGCNGRLLDQQFVNNAWQVTADIEGQQVHCAVPLLGEHVPLATVSVLLAAHCLGADVAQAAADLADYQPYETQGVLRRIAHRGGEFLCYDNSSRASVLSYQSALRMAARLRPPSPGGKKVAVIGQMIFLGKESEKWHAELASWVGAAGFDRVILVGKYTEITYACLPDPARVVHRFPNYDRRTSSNRELQALIAAIEETCAPGDLLFVKGEVDELGLALQARQLADDASAATPPKATAATPAVALPKPAALTTSVQKPDVSALAGLRTLQLADITRYRAAIDQTQRTVWQHYFPFIYLLSQSPGYKFLVEEDAGSFCIYMLREKKDGQHLNVFLLPMPMQPAVLARCIERVKAFGHGERVSLFRVDAEDAKAFRSRPNTRVVTCEQEYIYAPANYLDLSGGKSGKLRREINSVLKHGDLEVLDYQTAFAAECQQVLARWAAIQRQKYASVHYEGFTNACLRQYDQFGRADLFGKVLRWNGQICSFGFGGEMRQGLGNIFIVYSDMQLHALSRFMNYTLLLNMQHLALANAAHAGDTPGLAAAKQAMLPVFLHQPYQVYVG